MAQKPDGKAAGTERVTFTRPAAERIASVVRKVEAGDRDSAGLRFERVASAVGSPLRLATFTGNWATGQYKTVTLHGSTQTASVYNWCNPATGGSTSSTTSSRYVIFGRTGSTNSVVEIQYQSGTCVTSLAGFDLTSLPGYSSNAIQLLGHAAAGTSGTSCPSLTWYSITTCSTATTS